MDCILNTEIFFDFCRITTYFPVFVLYFWLYADFFGEVGTKGISSLVFCTDIPRRRINIPLFFQET